MQFTTLNNIHFFQIRRIPFYFLTFLSCFFLSLSVFGQRVELDEQFLSTDENNFRAALSQSILSLNDWIQELEQQGIQLICLGETHSNHYRDYYAEHFFSKYAIDTLFLEATQPQVDSFLKGFRNGDQHLNLLAANIFPILQAVLAKNPDARIIGVEATIKQKSAIRAEATEGQTKQLSRESYIAQNVFDQFKPNQKHVMLYGSLHCAHNDFGLGTIPAYMHLKKFVPEGKIRSVRTFFRSRLDYFSASLSLLNLPEGTLVFKDTPQIDPIDYSLAWEMQKILKNYQDVIFAAD